MLIVRKCELAALSAVVSLLVLELVLRLTGLGVHGVMQEWARYATFLVHDDQGDYLRHPARTSIVLQGVTMRFNSLGMRDEEPRVPKPPGTFRILCVGDSHTVGPGVAQDAIYPARLRALLARGALDVVAAGVGGWNTVAEARFLAQHVDALGPDLVLLLYVTNDTEPTEAFDRSRQPSELYRALVLHSRLFEWGAWAYRSRIAAPDPEAMARWHWLGERGVRAFAADEPGWIESRAALVRIQEVARSRGGRLLIFLNDEFNGALEHAAWARLTEFGSESGVPVFDTFGFYAGHTPKDITNDGFRDPHQNALGHALLADGIARTLRAGGFLPSLAAVAR